MPERTSNPRQRLGRAGEQIARETLEARGLAIVQSNYRCAAGEMDLIARAGSQWVFAEVKTRRGSRFGTAAEAVNQRKQKKLVAVAEWFIQAHGLGDIGWRIDVVAIDMDAKGHILTVNVIENAVSR